MKTKKITDRRVIAKTISILLCLGLLFGMLLTANAAEVIPVQLNPKGNDPDEFILQVSTGVSAGSDIGFFSVEYDSMWNGAMTTYSEYIMARLGDHYSGIEYAMSIKDPTKRLDNLKGLGYNAPAITSGKVLQPFQTDSIYFKTEHPVHSFHHIDVMGSGKNHGWTCQALSLYQVDEVYGIDMTGYYSSQYFIDFKGTLLAATQDSETLTWATPTRFRFSPDDRADVKLVVPEKGNEVIHDGGENDQLIFRFDFADGPDAGFECLSNDDNITSDTHTSIKNMGICETLAAQVAYRDTGGSVREVVLPVVLSSLGYALENGVSENAEIADLAPQGSSLGFVANLPNFAAIENMRLIVGGDAAEKATGLSLAKASGKAADRKRKSNSDDIALNFIGVYRAGESVIRVNSENSMLNFSYEGTPIYYFSSSNYGGERFPAGTKNVTIRENQGGTPRVVPSQGQDRYLISIKTSAPEMAGTNGDVKIDLKYMNTSGQERTTGALSIAEYVENYYGFWPSSASEDFVKTNAFTSGATAEFAIEIKDVDYFTGAKFSLEGSGGDDWQMDSLEIFRLSYLYPRKSVWESVSNSAGASNRRYYRESDKEQMLLLTQTVLLMDQLPGEQPLGEDGLPIDTSGDTGTPTAYGANDIELDFQSLSVTEVEDDISWVENRYAMTYEESMQDFGFAKTRFNYNVDVQVKKDTYNGDGDDSGSKNLFYFQLIFENGQSGCVLANQQLVSDGFRAGTNESFTIGTNQDYGELSSVRIIPEDISAKSDIFDKLNIERITVSKQSFSANMKQWVMDDVGWVGIDYREEAEATSLKGKQGRSAEEMSRIYPRTRTVNAVNLLFTVTTDHNTAVKDENGEVTGESPAFSGKVMATLYYKDSANIDQKLTFDMVRAIQAYRNESAQSPGVDAVNSDTTIDNAQQSDPASMFRPNSRDRFMLSIGDITSVSKLVLQVKGTTVTDWNISSVYVETVVSDGTLRINDDNEYQRTNTTMELAQDIAASDNAVPAHSIAVTGQGAGQRYTINMDSKTISFTDESAGSWASSTVLRVPASQNDTLNIFVYPRNKADGGGDFNSYDLRSSVRYTNNAGRTMQVSTGSMNRSSQNGDAFYVMGVNANKLSAFQSLNLQAYAANDTVNCSIDHAVIQRVRNNVVIDSYYINYAGGDAFYGLTSDSTGQTGQLADNTREVIYLMLGPATEDRFLFAERQDLAIALQYTTTTDPSGTVLQSPNVYLTDLDIKRVGPNRLIKAVLSEPYVKEVKGLVLSGTGTLAVQVDSAAVGVYDTDVSAGTDAGNIFAPEETMTPRSYVSFNNGASVHANVQTLLPTADTLTGRFASLPLTVKFATASADKTAEAGVDCPVRMILTTENADGSESSISYPDIRQFIQTGDQNFAAGEERRIDLLIGDVARIKQITLEPYDNTDEIVSWQLDSVSFKLSTLQQRSRRVEERIFENAPRKISTTNIDIWLRATAKSAYTDNDVTQEARGENMQFILDSGRELKVNVRVEGSSQGVNGKAERVLENGARSDDVNKYLEIKDGEFVFKPIANYTGKTMVYVLTFSSQEAPDIYQTIEVSVPTATNVSGNNATEVTVSGNEVVIDH